MKTATFAVISVLFLALSMGPARADKPDIGGALQRMLSGDAATAPLASEQMVARGLKEALSIGAQKAIDHLGQPNGFLADARARISVPQNMKTAETTLRSLGQGRKVDEFIAAMNTAATRAVPKGAGIFTEAIRAITMEDAMAILNGPDDAATKYFQRHTRDSLKAAFLPIVRESMAATQVVAYYNALNGAYQSYGKPLMEDERVRALTSVLTGAPADADAPPPEADLDAYVTREALDGLFLLIASEEKQIREQPGARVTDLLKQVFGGSARP